MFVEVELNDVLDHPFGATPLLVLKEKKGRRVCCIDVGWVEANTIADQLEGILPPRPLTHDLLLDALSHVGSSVEGIYIEKEQARTYFASVRITKPDGKQISLDARPSDAITLALKQRAPIFMNESLFKESRAQTATGATLPCGPHPQQRRA